MIHKPNDSVMKITDKATLEKRVVEIIKNNVPKEKQEHITLKSELGADLDMDSLSQMELLMELDELMETETEQEVAQTLKTVQSIIDYAWSKKQKQIEESQKNVKTDEIDAESNQQIDTEKA